MQLTSKKSLIFYSEDPNQEELRFKRLHGPTVMINQSSIKRKLKKKVHASSTSKDAKTPKKRDRKVVPPINRPTLSMVCIFYHICIPYFYLFSLDLIKNLLFFLLCILFEICSSFPYTIIFPFFFVNCYCIKSEENCI